MDRKFYVSLEAARLLKEKGYNEERDFLTPVYEENGCLYWSNHEDLSDKIPAITKSEAMDWLERKIIIGIGYDNLFSKWHYDITPVRTGTKEINNLSFSTRLEAEEAAIIEALGLLN